MSKLANQISTGEINLVEYVSKVLSLCKNINKGYHYFNNISEESALDQAKLIQSKKKLGKLAGVVVSVKDAISVKDVESRAGSAILNGYKPLYDATVISRIKKEDGIVIGKTSQDSFGFGSFNVNVGMGFKVPLNPHDKTRVTGGSSGGCCGAVKKLELPHISLGESTGGSIACPSAFCGVFGLTPTYSRVSRYGLMDYGSSLDKIGPIGNKLDDVALMLEIISGFDHNESTSSDEKVEKYSKYLGKGVKGLKVGVVKEGFGEGVDDEVKDKVENKIGDLEDAGVIVNRVLLPKVFKYGIPTYYLLAAAEASTNLALYNGMRFGSQENISGGYNEYFSSIRQKYFSTEVKRRVMLGTFARMSGYRDAYYLKATKVRTLLINEYKTLFKKYDVLVSPSMPIVAPKFKEVEKLSPVQQYMTDILTVGPNLGGFPHLSIPCESKLPVGMMIIGNHFDEGKILQVGSV